MRQSVNGRFIQWQKLPDSPSPITKLIGIKNSQNHGNPLIYVEIPKSKLFGANLDECFSTSQLCWGETSQIENVSSVGECEYKFDVGQPPNGIVNKETICNRFANGPSPSEVYTSVVLLSDGSIWVWRYEHWELENLLVFINPYYLGVRGLVAGILISIILWLSKKYLPKIIALLKKNPTPP